MERVIFHLDMDAFYASVEQRDNPELRGKPVVVGGSPASRGVVCAASYEARKFGVRSAMPSVTAGRLCPNGVFVRPRMDVYRDESRQIMNIVRATGAVVETVSIDEAYLDVTEAVAAQRLDDQLENQGALVLARALKQRIRDERRLSATIGVAPNKLLAKLASDFRKPDGLTLIPERDKQLFLRPLSVRSLHGVGPVTEKDLHSLGIETIGDLQDFPGDLRSALGSFAAVLRRYAFGNDDRLVEPYSERKSISSEETFARDTEDRPTLRKVLRAQAAEISETLRSKQLLAHTVQIKIRYGDFSTLSRQLTLEDPLDRAEEIYRIACYLLGRERLVNRPLRLIGVGVANLQEAGPVQLPLFPEKRG